LGQRQAQGDVDGEAIKVFSVTGFPSFVLLDKDNDIVIKGSHEYALLQFTLEVFV